jgi:hypothetical protein
MGSNQSFRGIVCFQPLIADFISPDSCIVCFQWLGSIRRSLLACVPPRPELSETRFLKNNIRPRPVWQEIVAWLIEHMLALKAQESSGWRWQASLSK